MEDIFETPRLRCRRLRASDVTALHAVYGDADAMRWVGDGKPLSLAECERWLLVTEENYLVRGYGMFALLDRMHDQIVGFCGLVHPGGQREAEIKYALRRDFWGRGLATEAAQALLAYGARQLGLRRVIATAAADNMASHRVLTKAGMVPEELRRNFDGSHTQVFSWQLREGGNTNQPVE